MIKLNVQTRELFINIMNKKLMFEFIEWKDSHTEYLPLKELYEFEIETHVIETMTLKMLFDYWLTNIKYI
jgi:hypothetical protein